MISDGGNGNGNGKSKSRKNLKPPFAKGNPSIGKRPRGRPSFRLAVLRAIEEQCPNGTLKEKRTILDAMVKKQVSIVLEAELDKDSVAAFKTLANVVDGQRINSTVEVNDLRKSFDWSQLIPSEAPMGPVGSNRIAADVLPGAGNGGTPRRENGNGKHD